MNPLPFSCCLRAAGGFAETLQAYRQLGVDVFVLMQVPQQKVVPENAYAQIAYLLLLERTAAAAAAVRDASIDYPTHLKLQAYNRSVIERLAKDNGAVVLNPDPYFCTVDRCMIGDVRTSYYRDSNHVNAGGASRMEPLLRRVFQ